MFFVVFHVFLCFLRAQRNLSAPTDSSPLSLPLSRDSPLHYGFPRESLVGPQEGSLGVRQGTPLGSHKGGRYPEKGGGEQQCPPPFLGIAPSLVAYQESPLWDPKGAFLGSYKGFAWEATGEGAIPRQGGEHGCSPPSFSG